MLFPKYGYSWDRLLMVAFVALVKRVGYGSFYFLKIQSLPANKTEHVFPPIFVNLFVLYCYELSTFELSYSAFQLKMNE